MEILGVIIVVLACVGIGTLGYTMEKRSWNGGRCPTCVRNKVRNIDTVWRHFDNDSQGGRGYKCTQGHTVWISYSVDKKGVYGKRHMKPNKKDRCRFCNKRLTQWYELHGMVHERCLAS